MHLAWTGNRLDISIDQSSTAPRVEPVNVEATRDAAEIQLSGTTIGRVNHVNFAGFGQGVAAVVVLGIAN